MRCPICNQDVSGSCLCNFCINCLEEYGHEKCVEMLKQKTKDKK